MAGVAIKNVRLLAPLRDSRTPRLLSLILCGSVAALNPLDDLFHDGDNLRRILQ